jgi:hypothetical protein
LTARPVASRVLKVREGFHDLEQRTMNEQAKSKALQRRIFQKRTADKGLDRFRELTSFEIEAVRREKPSIRKEMLSLSKSVPSSRGIRVASAPQ